MATIDEKFETFRSKYPDAWNKFCALADGLWERGVRHYSSKTLMEVMRYHSDADMRPDCKWKLNNNLTPILSRKYMELHPDRQGFFSFKPLKKVA